MYVKQLEKDLSTSQFLFPISMIINPTIESSQMRSEMSPGLWKAHESLSSTQDGLSLKIL